ncbi:CLUMA_CG018615, isoform A [Clunio marinus]|uniref:CLUMA_CG018615, isoform A n=1 Tax=Clunio marinus TaxID=568069 RepID=A0A1J1IYZ9_9DIPT|nr:CLUMA_CG018615, isoform A [Clunio marinus]
MKTINQNIFGELQKPSFNPFTLTFSTLTPLTMTIRHSENLQQDEVKDEQQKNTFLALNQDMKVCGDWKW